MADKTERDISKILGNQGWMKAALGELLDNNAALIANQSTQITTLQSILTVLERIHAEHTTEEEVLAVLEDIRQTLEIVLG